MDEQHAGAAHLEQEGDGASHDEPRPVPAERIDHVPEFVWKRMYVLKSDLEQYGVTEHCPACRSFTNNSSRSGMLHTDACRMRLVAALQTTEEGNARLQREHERENKFLAKAVELAVPPEPAAHPASSSSARKRSIGESEA